VTAYRPSPRPTFDGPAAIPYASVTRHIWGDPEAGEVADWIYASTERVHALVFGLAPGAWFRHSPEFRTIFGADELLYVLRGTMMIANPETGEVLRVPRGGHAFFRADTWHHVHAHGNEELRVLELYAPPPATGSSGAYARTKPYLEPADWRYGDDSLLGRLPGAEPARRTLFEPPLVWRRSLGVLEGLYASTEHLTAGVLELNPGETSVAHTHGGDEVVYALEGVLHVRAFGPEGNSVFELNPDDAAYIPQGVAHEYRSYGSAPVRALFGVAPAYLP
jgi:mannose-6-phosphate isomerase-like protein (cupin superfamily)